MLYTCMIFDRCLQLLIVFYYKNDHKILWQNAAIAGKYASSSKVTYSCEIS